MSPRQTDHWTVKQEAMLIRLARTGEYTDEQIAHAVSQVGPARSARSVETRRRQAGVRYQHRPGARLRRTLPVAVSFDPPKPLKDGAFVDAVNALGGLPTATLDKGWITADGRPWRLAA